jgi:hypothetical protein
VLKTAIARKKLRLRESLPAFRSKGEAMVKYGRTLVGFVVIAAATLVTSANIASRSQGDAASHSQAAAHMPMASVDEKALAATGDDPAAVRAFTDEIFETSLLAGAAESLKERVARSEIAFRQGGHAGVSEEALVKVANEHVKAANGAEHMYVSAKQLHMQRQLERLRIHHFADGPASKGKSANKLTEDMSPAEALLVSTHLALQKFTNPEYQVPPEQWERATRARWNWARKHPMGGANAQGAPQPRLTFGVSAASSEMVRATQQALADEASAATAKAHAVLDTLGLPR